MSQNSSQIKLPLTIRPTSQGEFFFSQHESLIETKKTRATRNSNHLSFKAFSAVVLKRMLASGYISQIEVTRTDFNSKRAEIIDLSKLISYGILQYSYASTIADKLNRTNLINQWNRDNPSKMLTSDNIATNFYIKHKHSPDEVSLANSAMRQLLTHCFNSPEAKRHDLSKENRKLLLLKAKNHLDCLNSKIWPLMMKAWNTPNCQKAVATINDVLWEYLSKSDITDYLSLLVMELALAVEKALILKATTNYLKGQIELEHFMRNSKDRDRLFKSLRDKNETASLIWRIKGIDSEHNVPSTLNLVVANRISESGSVLKLLGNSGTKPKPRSIAGFYKDLGSEENEIGLHYLNCLEEECRRLGVKLNTYTNVEKERNIFSVNLSIRF